MTNSIRVTGSFQDGISSGLSKLRDNVDRFSKSGALTFAAGQLAANAVTAGIGMATSAVENFVGDSINAYRDQEVAQTRLNQTLKENVTGWNGDMSAIQAATQASEKLGFTNTETTESLSTLVGATHDVAQSLNILSVAQDLARYKNISLSDAVGALTKIEGGDYRILKSLGIELPKGTTQVEALAAVMKIAGGQAQQFAQTDLGKMDVASVKVNAAEEKLGKGLSELAAVVLPALADGVDNVATAFTGLGDSIDQLPGITSGVTGVIATGTTADLQKAQQALEMGIAKLRATKLAPIGPFSILGSGQIDDDIAKLQSDLDLVNAALGNTGANVGTFGRSLDTERGSVQDVNTATIAYTHSQYALDAATLSAEQAAAAAAPPLDKLLTIAPLLAREVSNAATQFTDLGTSLDSALFGKAELMGNIASAQMGLNAVLKQEPQKHSGDAWAVWQGQVAQARQALFDLQYQQEQSAGPTALLAWLKKQDATFGKTNTTAHDYLVTLENLAKFQITSGNDVGVSLRPGVQARAAGGPVVPGRDYLVGEDGPELLQMGSAGGNVKPLGGRAAVPSTAAPSSGGDVLTINVITPVATPGSMEALARYLEPILTRRQQRRGVIALGVR